jgi:c-di-GMP-binding flagellar brake protein YcgR
MDDKRRESRLHTVHLVSYTKFAPEKIPELMGMGSSVDLSEGGIRMTTREPLEEGDVLQLEFAIDDKVVKADARVIHVEEVRHYVVGFRFEGVAPEEQDKIRGYLARRQTSEGGDGNEQI